MTGAMTAYRSRAPSRLPKNSRRKVIAVDIDARKVEAITAGQSYIEDVPSELLGAMSERIHACTRYSRLAKAHAVLVCVPTPLTRNRERTDFTLRNTPKVLGGLTEACAERAEALYGLVCDQLVPVSTPEAPS